MNRLVLTFTALLLGPLLSGCCCCGTSLHCGPSYGGCLPYGDSYSTGGGSCSDCQGDGFSLPPEGSSYPIQSGMPYGMPYGTTYGPEIVGPEFVPEGSEWQVVPDASGAPSPVTPAPSAATTGPNALLPPSPVPAISTGSNGIPSPAPYAASVPATSTGPMMPPVPPPPPEPISQMRFRQYR